MLEPQPPAGTLAFHVYILTSIHQPFRYYIGFSANPFRRLLEHNNNKNPSTAKHAPWRIAATISFSQESEAMAFERYLKSGSGRSFLRKHLLFGTERQKNGITAKNHAKNPVGMMPSPF